ncbi:UNVERIFIED_CONTAM: hypothetical protein Sindi_0939100, partial [Sesamum indicum]
MSRHAPLYGAGLEALSMKELETISRIHEEGLRQIHAIQQRKGSPAGSPFVSSTTYLTHMGCIHLLRLQWLLDCLLRLSQMVLGSIEMGMLMVVPAPGSIVRTMSLMTSLIKKLTQELPVLSRMELGRGAHSPGKWNFLSFKEIMETRKIFRKFFQAGGCELRIGVYESFDTICIYLESDQSVGSDPEKTWNNSVIQFMKVSDMLEADAGFLLRDTVVFVCEILDYCPWFEFSDLE